QREAVAVDDDRRGEGGQAFRVIGAGDRDRTEELEVALRPADTGIDVDDDAVASWQRQRALLADPALGPDRRVTVADHGQVVPDQDQVHAGVRSGPAPVLRQRRARRLLDGEGQLRRPTCPDRLYWSEARQLKGLRRADRRDVDPGRRAARRGGEDRSDARRSGEQTKTETGTDHQSPFGKRYVACGGMELSISSTISACR